ncbi:MAG: PTS sugar transporter subunit IIC [Ruminococcus sp.]
MIKKYLHRVFIDGLSGMAMGLFATLIVGTIIQQIGTLIGGQIGDLIFLAGKVAAAATCAGIGVGVAHKFQESSLVVLSAATCGMIGGYASKLLAGTVFSDGSIILAGTWRTSGRLYRSLCGN